MRSFISLISLITVSHAYTIERQTHCNQAVNGAVRHDARQPHLRRQYVASLPARPRSHSPILSSLPPALRVQVPFSPSAPRAPLTPLPQPTPTASWRRTSPAAPRTRTPTHRLPRRLNARSAFRAETQIVSIPLGTAAGLTRGSSREDDETVRRGVHIEMRLRFMPIGHGRDSGRG